jgi:hypothetical protein
LGEAYRNAEVGDIKGLETTQEKTWKAFVNFEPFLLGVDTDGTILWNARKVIRDRYEGFYWRCNKLVEFQKSHLKMLVKFENQSR